jgi:inner membrane protease subunit 1
MTYEQNDDDDEEILKEVYVPKGKVFLIGDNIKSSHDSRDYGPIPYGLIQLRVLFKVIL